MLQKLKNNLFFHSVGLFKSENKDTFLKVFPNKTDGGFVIESEKGININKLDR